MLSPLTRGPLAIYLVDDDRNSWNVQSCTKGAVERGLAFMLLDLIRAHAQFKELYTQQSLCDHGFKRIVYGACLALFGKGPKTYRELRHGRGCSAVKR